jgi:hypothetical protein
LGCCFLAASQVKLCLAFFSNFAQWHVPNKPLAWGIQIIFGFQAQKFALTRSPDSCQKHFWLKNLNTPLLCCKMHLHLFMSKIGDQHCWFITVSNLCSHSKKQSCFNVVSKESTISARLLKENNEFSSRCEWILRTLRHKPILRTLRMRRSEWDHFKCWQAQRRLCQTLWTCIWLFWS